MVDLSFKMSLYFSRFVSRKVKIRKQLQKHQISRLRRAEGEKPFIFSSAEIKQIKPRADFRDFFNLIKTRARSVRKIYGGLNKLSNLVKQAKCQPFEKYKTPELFQI